MAKMTVPYILIFITVLHKINGVIADNSSCAPQTGSNLTDTFILSSHKHSFYVIVMSYKTQADANSFCMKFGGRPANVKSDTEECDLKNKLTAVQPPVMIDVNVTGMHYKKTELNMTNQDFLLIEAKLPNDAIVVLSQYTHFDPSKSLMVVIGGWLNTQSAIRIAPEGKILVKRHTPNLLKQGENRRFWVSWKNGLIQAGRGWVLGADIIVEYKNPTPFTVSHLSLTTNGSAAGVIKLPSAINPESQIVTQVKAYHYYDTGLSLEGQEFLLFEVKITNDVHIALSMDKTLAPSKMYEIVIGGWSGKKSSIRTRKQGPDHVVVSTPSIVSANEYRMFWVTWKDGFVRVGRGWVPGVDVFMQYKNPSPFDVRYLAFSAFAAAAGTVKVPTGADGPITNTDRLFDIRYWTSNHCGNSSSNYYHCKHGGSSQCVVLAQSKRYKPKAVPCSDKAFTLCQFGELTSV